MPWPTNPFRKRLRGARSLDRALTALEGDTKVERRRRLYDALLRADLAVITSEDRSTAGNEGHEGVQLQGTLSADGELMLPAFTNPESMHAWNPDVVDGVAIPAQELFAYFMEVGAAVLLVNPGGHPSAELSPAEVSALAEGKIPTRGDQQVMSFPVGPGTEIEIGRPAYETLPTDFVPALRAACAKVPAVERAYVFALAMPKEEPHHVVGLRLSDTSDPEPAVRQIGDAMSEDVEPFEFIEFHFLDDELENAVRSMTTAVFER